MTPAPAAAARNTSIVVGGERQDKMPSKKEKILDHLKKNLNKWIHNQELRDLSGLNDVPRTVRLLRQEGWEVDVRGDGYVMLTSLAEGVARGKREAINEKVRYQVFSRDAFRCRACGRSVKNGVKLNIDHATPVDWGGINDISNLITLCDECNRGKKAWVNSVPSQSMQQIMGNQTVEKRIEALFDEFPNQDIPSLMIQLVSKGSLDWQRALRRIRQRTGKKILPIQDRTGYHYIKEQ